MKRFFPILLAFHFLANLVGCPPTPSGSATCAQVCARGSVLGCQFAKPTAKGAACTTVCENLQASGLPKWNLGCRATAVSCAAMDDCQ
jgi:hypothetical protein